MAVRISTKTLLELLGDLILTADYGPNAGPAASVLLYTTRAAIGDEPGETDVLCGFSHRGGLAGYTHAECISGELPRPVLVPVRDAKALIAVFKPAVKDDMHAVDIRVDGQIVEVSEDPSLFDDGRKLAFAHADLAGYAGPAVFRLLQPAPVPEDVEDVAVTPRTDYWADRLAPFAKIAARRVAPVRLYREHQGRRVLVQIGDSYRGAVAPVGYDPVGLEDEPEVDVLLPDLEVYAELTGTEPVVVPGQRAPLDIADDEQLELTNA